MTHDDQPEMLAFDHEINLACLESPETSRKAKNTRKSNGGCVCLQSSHNGKRTLNFGELAVLATPSERETELSSD